MSACRAAVAALMLAGLAGAALPAAAQDSRAAVIAAAQAEKARRLRPYTPTAIERIVDKVERGAWLDPVGLHGVHPTFRSVLPGGGFTMGLGWRYFTGYASHLDLHASYSMHGYRAFEARAVSPRLAGDRLDVAARAGWRDVTRVGYFGLGTSSAAEAKAAFGLQTAYVEGGVTWRPARRAFVSAAVGYEVNREHAGDGFVPSIETRFDATTAPNLGADPAYVRAQVDAGFDWLASPGYSRRGGLIRVGHDYYLPAAGTGGRSFGVGHVEVVQHLPILRETWVLSLRGRGDSVTGDQAAAPYFLLPSLGSATTLRAYEPFRFRDLHAMLFTAEWRWTPNRAALDVALFADAGAAASRRRDFRTGAARTDVGVGLRFHTLSSTVLRLDLARGSEGWRFVFTNAAAF